MPSITLPRQEMIDILYGDSEKGRLIQDEISGTSRWSTHHDIIFEYEGKFYESSYSVGSTEYQDESPWDYEKNVRCMEVRRYEKTIWAYEVIPDDNNKIEVPDAV